MAECHRIPLKAGRLFGLMYYVYILRSGENGSYYIGQTKDLENRLQRHNAGHMRSTRAHAPFEIIYSEAYTTRKEAVINREKQIKSYKGGEAFKRLIK